MPFTDSREQQADARRCGQPPRRRDRARGSVLGPGPGHDRQALGRPAAEAPSPLAAGVARRDLRARGGRGGRDHRRPAHRHVVGAGRPGTGVRARGPEPGARGGSARSSGAAAAPRAGRAVRAQAAAVRAQAATWVAGQVGGDETIACDPSMCTALSAHGVAPSRLLSLPPSASGAPDADIIAASGSTHAWLSADAPTLLASVGSGASLIEVRAVYPGGAAAYQAALRSDLAARRSAGTQLIHTRRIEVGAQAPASSRRARWIPACWRRSRCWRRSTPGG